MEKNNNKVILNISNHPVQTWRKPQVTKLKKMSGGTTIIDIPFPAVNPAWDENTTKKVAKDLIEYSLSFGEIAGAYIMGEDSMVYQLNDIFMGLKIPTYMSYRRIKNSSSSEYVDCEYLIKRYIEIDDAELKNKKKAKNEGVFINISSHPSLYWAVEQKIDVTQLGAQCVTDWGLPLILPTMKESEIIDIVNSVYEKIEKFSLPVTGVLVQGDQLFTDTLVRKIKKTSNLPVYCVTNERKVSSGEDGKKVSIFEYGGIRKY